ncbi:MAG: hypothetical protein AAF934_02505 [Bacteroidota bacterium]
MREVKMLPGRKVEVTAAVTLKRKICRNAKGNIKITMNYSIDWSQCKICVHDPKIKQVKLSNTLRIGENIYKKIANRTTQ